MRDERKDTNKTLEIILWAALGLLALHFYVELHLAFKAFGLAHPFADTIIGRMVENSTLFQSPWMLKSLSGICICAYGATSQGVKSADLTRQGAIRSLVIGLILFLGSTWLITSTWIIHSLGLIGTSGVYGVISLVGFLYLLKGSQELKRVLFFDPRKDIFNRENESFPQEERLMENPHSVNIPTEYQYGGKTRRGWINLVNPFRGLLVVGSAGSGKSFSLINPIIRQQIRKGFAMYIYDFKFADLSLIAFNAMVRYREHQPKGMKFYCINFDDPRKSHRCNPLHPIYLENIADANQSARMMMLNLNRKWIGKEGEFFVDTPIAYVTCIIWYLRQYQEGRFCTLPHVVELLTVDYRKVFPLLASRPDLEAYSAIFVSALEGGAMEQLEGQMASARSGPSKLSSPNLYWTMSGNDFMLDINNRKEPKIVCIGNNSKRSKTYGAALSLYNARILNLINQKGKHPSAVVIDELPTLFFEGLANLINTGRSCQIAVTIAMQNFAQLDSEYGRDESEVIKNSCGSVISGQATGHTAEAMQNRLGKNVQRKENLNIQSEDTTHGISTELNFVAPAAKIGQLSQGQFVGVIADDVTQLSDLKALQATIKIDEADFKAEQKYKELPNFSIFAQEGDQLQKLVDENFMQIKTDIQQLVASETARLAEELGVPLPSPQKNGKKK